MEAYTSTRSFGRTDPATEIEVGGEGRGSELAEWNSLRVTEAERKYLPVMTATRPRPSTPAVTSSAVEAPEKPEGPLR